MDSRPVSVTVFSDRARVTRAGQVQLDIGAHRLEFADLPLGLLPDSVRASGRGTARARLLGVSTRLENFVETPAEKARQLEHQIQDKEDVDFELLARAANLEKAQAALEGVAAQSEMFARGLALRGQTPESTGAALAYLASQLQANRAEQLQVARQRRELARELDRLRRDLKALQSARPRQRYVAAVEVEVSAAGGLELELTYVVTGARWQPRYDLRLGEAGLEVTYLAEVAQTTGEDWPGVSLTLSTARPSVSLEVPEPDPWFVRAYTPVPVAAKAAVRGMAFAAQAVPPPAAAPARLAMDEQAGAAVLEEVSAEVSASGAALTYRLPGQADVPGGGDPRKVTVASFSLQPQMDYVTAPRLEAVCYRRATVRNDSPYTLLPGPAQVFEGEDFLGATALELTAPSQEIELALGVDERLRVERRLVNREVDKSLLGDRRRIRYAYTIEIENLRDAPQTVLVRDQFPVSRDEQIKVRLESAEPKPGEHTELNQLEWKLTLARGARQVLRFDFSVDHPRALQVIGLP